MKAILLLPALLFCCLNLKAQSYLLEKFQNATYVNAMIGKERAINHKGVTIGHTVNGRLDMSVSAGFGDGKGLASFYTITPSVGYLVVKQGKIPFSLGVSAGFEAKRFTRVDQIKHNTLRGGLALYHQFKLKQHVSIIPGAFGGMDYKTRLLDTVFRDHVKTYSIGIQSTFLFNRFSITPSFSHSKDGNFLSLKLGLLFPGSEMVEPLD